MNNQREKLFDWDDLVDPVFWGCCAAPALIGSVVLVGILYKFIGWAFE